MHLCHTLGSDVQLIAADVIDNRRRACLDHYRIRATAVFTDNAAFRSEQVYTSSDLRKKLCFRISVRT